MALRIIYYGNCWMTNLGEAFIDIGAMELLKQALPDSEIIFLTPMSKYYNNALRIKSENEKSSRAECMKNAAHLGLYMKADMLVMSGMFATEDYLINGSATYWIDDFLMTHPDVKVLFMGLGGQNYDQQEITSFANYIKTKINLLGFISRDNEAYTAYSNIIDCCYPGIDCAYFVKDAYNPSGFADKEYIVSTFNYMAEPEILRKCTVDVIRAQHMFYSASYREEIKNIFISDAPYDYLSLYANAKEVHTDLVHATIVSLAYGIKVKYYYESKRALAFAAAGAVKNNDGYIYLPDEILTDNKNKMINTVNKIVRDEFNI